MNQVSKPIRLVLPTSNKFIGELLKDSRVTPVYLSDEICVLESSDPELLESSQWSDQTWTRIFEEYHLASVDDDKAQGVVVSAFFDWFADRYSGEITVTRNIACYEKLYDFANQFRDSSSPTAVLDLGCGPGTILRSHVAHLADVLVGYDISAVAAQAAIAAGMRVMSREQFLAGPAQFDVALSAYTMHYSCDLADTLAGVQCNLKPGGVWAFNLHKGIGSGAILDCLRFNALGLSGRLSHSPFGPIAVVRMG